MRQANDIDRYGYLTNLRVPSNAMIGHSTTYMWHGVSHAQMCACMRPWSSNTWALISSSGLAEWIAGTLSVAGTLPTLLLIVLVAGVIVFLTEVTSNTATAAAFLPLLGALAESQGVSPVLLTVPAAIAASCAFMMPVATPPNAIVFSSGHMRIADMIRAGLALNLMGIAVVTLLCYGLIALVFSL